MNHVQTDALVQNQPDFRNVVMNIDNDLHDDDIENMKFLCQGLVVGRKLNLIDSAYGLIEILMNANCVTEGDFFLLADLLQYIGRVDVLENVGFEEREVIVQRRHGGSKIKPFYVLLFKIAEDLAPDDVSRAVFAYGKVPRSQKISTGLDLFTLMVQHRAIHPGNVELLITIFNTLERNDIVEQVRQYIDTQGQSVIEDLERNFVRVMNLRGCNAADVTFAAPKVPPPCGSGFGPSLDDNDVREPNPVSDYTDLIQRQTLNEPSAPQVSVSREEALVQTQSPGSVTVPPEGYDESIIPWSVMVLLSKKIPTEYWPHLTTYLGVHSFTESWSPKTTEFHKLAVLKRWLQLSETREKNALEIRNFLVKALHDAGPTLMAQQVADKLEVDIANVLAQSISTQRSEYDTNQISSSASAAPIALDSMSVQMAMEQARSSQTEHETMPQSIGAIMSPIQYYNMRSIPRGYCVIINNREFYKEENRPDAKQMLNREGTDVDKEKLEQTFGLLDFIVQSFDNLTDSVMVHLMTKFAQQDNSRFDCFVCCILTHGVQGAVYGTNGLTVPIRDITAPFRTQFCPSLADKPKLFFLQACQGREKQRGHHSDIAMDSNMETDSPGDIIPNEADFLLGYATVPGFVSYRSKTRGSWYITKLTEMLNKYAHDHDILDILTLVNYEVGKGDAMIDGGQYKQSPAPMYSLRKKLIFSR